MAVPSTILDGLPPYGTKGTITISSVVYIIEDEKLTPNWDSAEDRLSTGAPSRKRWTKGRYGLELKLQLATASTAYPIPGSTFTYAVKNEATAPTFVVLSVPEDRNNEASFIETVTITCESTVGTVTTVT